MKSIYEQVYIETPICEVEISRDPITNKRRKVEAKELSINTNSIFLQTTVFFLDDAGNKINSERFNSYEKRLPAENSPLGPWVNPQTGERVDIVNGEVPDNAVTRYDFLRMILASNDPVIINQMMIGFIVNADAAPYKEYDI